MKSYLMGGAVLAAILGAAPAMAQSAPSESAMVNLVRALVQQGVLTEDRGKELIDQAEAEAAAARSAAALTAAQSGKAVAAGTVRVPYVPETVRQQIKDELRIEVLQAAQEEGWARPGEVAEWPKRIKISGDFRFRDQWNLFEEGNYNQLINFGQFNASGPIDINPSTNPRPGVSDLPRAPLYNTTSDRNNRMNFRARIAVDAKLNDWASVGFRLASGGDDSPISTTQLLGNGFGKKDLWLDRAFARITPVEGASLIVGRMPNPFYSYDVLYDEDLNFDGVAVVADSGNHFGDNFVVGGTLGAFPYEYSADAFPSASQTKAGERQKWIFGGQLTGTWQAREDLSAKLGVAYYDYDSVQGRPSEPCQLSAGNFDCSTDQDVPAFLNKGNTLFLLRNIVPPPSSPTDYAQPQFAALTFDYNILDLTADVTLRVTDNLSLIVGGDYIKNLGYDRNDFCKDFAGFNGAAGSTLPPVNNIDENDTTPCVDGGRAYKGGDTAWMLRATIGYPKVVSWGQWNLYFAYKSIEADSMLDSLTDSDFHLGGTNAKGYIVAGTFGLYDNVSVRGRWFSANEITGPQLSIDVLQLDLLLSF